jgi:hypothetical protein
MLNILRETVYLHVEVLTAGGVAHCMDIHICMHNVHIVQCTVLMDPYFFGSKTYHIVLKYRY